MPQAVCLFPVAPPQTARVNSPQPGADSGPSKFDGVLDSARNAETPGTDSPQDASATTSTATAQGSTGSTDATASTDKPAKPQKSKTPTSNASKTKPTKSRSQEANDADSDESAGKAGDSKAAVAQAEAVASTASTGDAKPKVPEHAAHPADATPPQPTDGTLANQPVQPLPVNDQPQDSAGDAGKEPSKGLAAVQAIKDQGTDDSAPAAQAGDGSDAATGTSASNAPGDGNAVAQGGAAKLGAKLAIKPSKGTASDAASNSEAPAKANVAATVAKTADDTDDAVVGPGQGNASAATASNPTKSTTQTFADTLAAAQNQSPAISPKNDAPVANVAAGQLPPAPREAQFADANHAQIVSGIQTQLLPNGGSMQIHLNPGELGSMSVSVHLRDGVMTATFEATNDQAARLLTHSLGQLKTALESQGVSVGRLHVQQTPKDSQTGSGGGGKNGESGTGEKSTHQQEQQRKEMLRKMWRRLNGGKDPLDMVA